METPINSENKPQKFSCNLKKDKCKIQNKDKIKNLSNVDPNIIYKDLELIKNRIAILKKTITY